MNAPKAVKELYPVSMPNTTNARRSLQNRERLRQRKRWPIFQVGFDANDLWM